MVLLAREVIGHSLFGAPLNWLEHRQGTIFFRIAATSLAVLSAATNILKKQKRHVPYDHLLSRKRRVNVLLHTRLIPTLDAR